MYSGNIVGYINRSISAGDNLIANQLGTTNDTLNNVLASGVLNGSTLTEWDPVANRFLPTSTFDAASSSWSINYSLTYGGGALLPSPSGGTTISTCRQLKLEHQLLSHLWRGRAAPFPFRCYQHIHWRG